MTKHTEIASPELDRRQFMMTTAIVGGGLAIGVCYPAAESRAATMNSKPWLPPSQGGVEIGSWVTIAPDNVVTLRITQSELGQQVFTSNAMMLCEELECDWSKVGVVYFDVTRHLRENKVYGYTSTGGSGSVRNGREAHQMAGAYVREQLRTAASQQWGVPLAEIEAKAGALTHKPTGRKLTYGELAAKAVAIRLDKVPAIKTMDQFTLMGSRVKLLGNDLRITGTATFGIDVVLPGMLYAAVKMPPTQGGKLKSFDFDAIKSLRGIIAAVPIEGHGPEVDGVAVVADNWWRANTALSIMPIEWDRGPNANISSSDISASFNKKMNEPGELLVELGNAEATLRGAAKTIEAVYENGYMTHATIEPMNCTAQVTGDRVELWLGTQNPEVVVSTATAITKMPPDKIFVRNCFLGTGFGRRNRHDDVKQALTVAMAMNGRPVQVLRSREEDMRHNPTFSYSAVAKFQAALGADGMPTALTLRKAGDSFGQNSPTSIVRPALAAKGVKAARVDNQVVRGLHELPYGIPNQRIDVHYMRTPLGTGNMRGTGSINNVFALEGFIDELAHAAGKDPVQYRRALLAANKTFDQRDAWIKMLDLAADKAGWGKQTLPKGTALGVAMDDRRVPGVGAEYIAVAAVVVKVTVSKAGEMKVDKVDIAFDYGPVAVNPVAIEQQFRGQIAFALGFMDQEITLRNGAVVESNFDDYPILRMAEMPKDIGIHLVKSNQVIYGIGEEVIPSVAPAVVNAIFAATGKRIRSLPLKHHDLSWT